MEIEQLDFAVEIFYEGRTGLDPVAAIIISDRADLADARAVNVPAQHCVHRMIFSVTDDRRLE